MDVEKRPYAVPGSMSIVQALLPQRNPGDRIKLFAHGALRKGGRQEVDYAFQDPGEVFLLPICRIAQADCSGDIGCPIQILPTRIDQIDPFRLQRDIGLCTGSVMNHCAVSTVGRDRLKTHSLEKINLIPEFSYFFGGRDFCDIGCSDILFEPAEELDHSYAIPDVCILESGNFCLVLYGFKHFDRARFEDQLCAVVENIHDPLTHAVLIQPDAKSLLSQALKLRAEIFVASNFHNTSQRFLDCLC